MKVKRFKGRLKSMKYLFCFCVVIGINLNGFAQGETVRVGFNKPTILIFPSPIVDHLCGSSKVSVSVRNSKYFMRAESETGFSTTSLFIELQNGSYYDLVLVFDQKNSVSVKVFNEADATGILKIKTELPPIVEIEKKSYHAVKDSAREHAPVKPAAVSAAITTKIEPEKKSPPIVKSSVNENVPVKQAIVPEVVFSNEDAEVAKTTQAMFICGDINKETKQNVYHIDGSDRSIFFSLEKLYRYNGMFFIALKVRNNSNLEYKVRSVEFSIHPNDNLVRKAPLLGKPLPFPIYVLNSNDKLVTAKKEVSWVYAFERFAVDEKNKLVVKLFEQDGDREVILEVHSILISNAEILIR